MTATAAISRKREWGSLLRCLRKRRKLSLHKLAAFVQVTPTYLFRIEKGELRPPAEERLVAIAAALGEDKDEFLHRAGRIASDLLQIIHADPRSYAALLRSSQGLSSRQLKVLSEMAQQMKQRKRSPKHT